MLITVPSVRLVIEFYPRLKFACVELLSVSPFQLS